MDLDRKYSVEELDKLSYRYLQQLAKAMRLPSNVKKVYLIQLIYAKTNKTAAEVEDIIESVKWQRNRTTMRNNKTKEKRQVHLQAMEVSSSSNPFSPPIDATPKRLRPPDQSYGNLIVNQGRMSPINKSDRILRSTNVKMYKKPNYSLLNDSILDMLTAVESEARPKQMTIISREKYPNVKIERSLVNKCKRNSKQSNVFSTIMLKTRDVGTGTMPALSNVGMLPALRSVGTMPALTDNAPIVVSKSRPNILSTNRLPENSANRKNMGIRSTDGKITKLQLFVRNVPKMYNAKNMKSSFTMQKNKLPIQANPDTEVSIQDIINSHVDAQTFTNSNVKFAMAESSDYPNMSAATDIVSEVNTMEIVNCNNDDVDTSYYHKKIRSDQIMSRRCSYNPSVPFSTTAPQNTERENLPKINEVFSKFNNLPNLTQPLYVQVSAESERINSYPTMEKNWVLDNMYNLRDVAFPKPLLKIATTFDTKCVYSTPLITTPAEQCSVLPALPSAPYHVSSTNENMYPNYGCTSEEVSRVCELINSEQDMTLRRYQEASACSSESPEQYLGALVTIPQMVEDALDLISQDGDYMERIGMNTKMQCILCSWAGPKFLLEGHIRDEHSSQILDQTKDEWVITFKLGSLVNQDVWLSQVSDRGSSLYILSVKYEDPSCFMASLSTLTWSTNQKTGTITLHNKVTGEPFTWLGQVQELCEEMPFQNYPDCLKVDLSELELLPNSANLKLHNRSLVPNTPSKAIVGQPELNDIHINIFVKIE